MKKRACFLLFVLAASAGAHSGDRVYPIYELTDEMLAKIDLRDGSVQEWADLLGEPSMTLLDFAYVYIDRSLDPSDLDFRIWLAWHDDTDRIFWPTYAATTHTKTRTTISMNEMMEPVRSTPMTASYLYSTQTTAAARVGTMTRPWTKQSGIRGKRKTTAP